MANIVTPPGIGDILFMYLKLHALSKALGEDVHIFPAGDEPRRSKGLVDILPNIKWGGYAECSANDVLAKDNPVISRVEQMKGDTVFLSNNAWMEAGHRIDNWLPQLPLSYDVKFNTTREHVKTAEGVLKGLNRPIIGVYTAAYGPVRNWGFWDFADWFKVVKTIVDEIGGSICVIGADFDVDLAGKLVSALVDAGIETAACIGAEFGAAVEVLKRVNVLLAFPSGLPITATLIGTPTVWWIPSHLSKLPGAYLNPKAVAAGLVMTRPFESPDEGIAGILSSAPLQRARDWKGKK